MTAALAVLPRWLAYFLFTSATLLFYIYVLRRISPNFFLISLLITFPAITICIRTGQNGFLLGALFGTFVLGVQRRKFNAIFALAFLSIKSHFLPAIYGYALLKGQWLIFWRSPVATGILICAVTFFFEPEIWGVFLNGIRKAGSFLQEGYYPLHRMTSLYAMLYTLGVPGKIAFIAQGTLGVIALCMILWAWRSNWQNNHLVAVFLMASLFISPYAYDYDLQVFGVALAVLIGDLCRYASAKQLIYIYLCGHLVCHCVDVGPFYR